ncbi:MAG: ABC transporter substrate-binding protein [Thermomicrobiales bacterium]
MNKRLVGSAVSTRARVKAIPAAVGLAMAGSMPRLARAQETTTVRLTGWTASPDEDRLLVQVLQDFEAAHPDIRVDYQPIPAEYPTKLQTDIAAGSVADVFYVDSLLAPDLMSREVLLPLDGYMSEAGVTAEDFYPGLIQAFQYNDATYGLPKDWSSLAMVYNQTAFEAAGIEAAPTTWDELRQVGEQLREATGEARINIPPDFARYIAFLYAGGGRVVSEDGSAVALDSDEARASLDFYYGLYRDGLASTPADVGASWPGDAFAKDFADIVFEGNWMFPHLASSAPELAFGVAEMPEGPGGKATMAFTVSYSAFFGTQVPNEAWTLINYLTGPEGMAKWTSLGLAMPARPALAEEWAQQFPERQPFLASGEYASPWALGPGGQGFFAEANSVLQGLFAGGMETSDAVADMAAAAEANIQFG